MASFRQQMQELVDKIALSRNERQQAVSQLPKMNDQLRRQVGRLREDTRRQLQRTATTLSRELGNFNSSNKRNVNRLLRETRSTRLNKAAALRSRLTREVSKNRSEIVRMITQNHAERKRMQRSQNRQSLQAIQNVHQRVESLRTGTQRTMRNLTLDRQEARRIWNNLRRTQPTKRAAKDTPAKAPAVTPLATAGLAVGQLTGLAMPPTNA